MLLTKKLLIQWNACQEGIDFCEMNKLFGFDLSRIDEIKGDYQGFAGWLRHEIRVKRIYDSNDNVVNEEDYYKDLYTYEYNKHGNRIKEENSYRDWIKLKYDRLDNIIKEGNSNSNWWKWEYDEHLNLIKVTKNTETEYYPNGQLKRINNLHLPLI